MQVDTSGLGKGMSNARGQIQGFTGAVDVSGKALVAFAAKAAVVLAPIIGLQKIISSTADAFREIGETSRLANRIGANVETLSGLQYAAQASGIELDRFNDALSDMTEKLGDARMGGGEGIEVLKALGLEADKLAGLDPAEAFTQIAGEIAKLENQADKLTLADKMFGDVGQELIPLIDKGAEGLAELQQRARELGVSFNAIDAAQVQLANNAIKEMKAVLQGVWRQLAINVAPILTAIARQLTDMGTTGIDISGMITTGMKMVAKGIAFAVDVVDAFKIAWLFLKKVFMEVRANILSGLATMAMKIQNLINKIPGVEVSFGSSLERMADKAREEAIRAGAVLEKELIKPSAGEKVDKFFAGLKEEAKKAAEEMKENKVTPNMGEVNKPAEDLIKSLKQQIEVLKVGADQAKLNELASQGVSAAMLEEVKALQQQKKALEASKKAAEELKQKQEELKKEAQSLTEKFRSPVEKFRSEMSKLREMFKKGLIDKDTFKSAAMDALPDKVKSIIEDSKTPLQKFQEQYQELLSFKNEGLLNDKQFQSAVGKLKEDLKLGPVDVKLASVAEAGSQEARDSIIRHQIGVPKNDPVKDLKKVSQDQLAQQNQQTGLLKKIASKQQEKVLQF